MSKIETNELRLNNWVYDLKTKTESQVTGILEDGAYLDGALSVANRIDEIEPIPITEERLLKMGFKFVMSRNDYGRMFFFNGIELHIREDGDIVFYYVLNRSFTSYDSVHEIQNLYFSLTGKELIIKS